MWWYIGGGILYLVLLFTLGFMTIEMDTGGCSPSGSSCRCSGSSERSCGRREGSTPEPRRDAPDAGDPGVMLASGVAG